MYNYDEFYKKYPVNQHDLSAFHSVRHAKTAELCRGNVLDVGCGTGNLADYYFGPYVGLDISEVAINKAKEIRRPGAQFYVRDALTPEKGAETKFDTIVISEILEHLDKDDVLFSNIQQWAKPDCRLIITCPNGPRIPDESHVRELTIPQLRKKLSPLGKVKFHNWAGAFVQIFCTVDLNQKNENLVSLVMIVKDEEKGLEQAVFSCLEFADNIVIAIDSKSTDKTKEIAKLYADKLKTFVFDNDFAKARNEAHANVKTKWCFFLDGHEYISKKENLEKNLALDFDGLLVAIELENGVTFCNPRFYKTGNQFEGKVHEKQSCENVGFWPDFLIKHNRMGAQGDESVAARLKQQDEMIPRIMGEQLKKDPKNIRALFHLGLYWQSKGGFRKAISAFARYLRVSKNKQERWFVLIHTCLCYMALGKNFRAFWAAYRADWEMKGRWETQKMLGQIFFFERKYFRALKCFVASLEPNAGETLYRPFPKENTGTWNLIGECFFNLGNYDKAGIAFDRAAGMAKDEKAKELFEKRAVLMREILKSTL